MFNMREFLVKNLIEGFANDSFNEVQINIFSANYLSKGMIIQKDFDYIMEQIELIKNPPEVEDIEEK